jgi:hypothetical protein
LLFEWGKPNHGGSIALKTGLFSVDCRIWADKIILGADANNEK